MAHCMLCSSSVGDSDVVCPHCGGAVEADATQVGGIDLTKVAEPPAAESGWPGETSGAPPGGPPTFGPPPGYGAGPPTFGPPSGGYGPPPGPPTFGPPSGGYGPPPGPQGYGPPPGPQGYGAPWPAYPPAPPNEGLAIASFLTSLVGLITAFLCFVPILACPVGAVLGHVALRRIEENGTQGRGLALAGIIIGWIATGLLVLGTIGFIALALASGSSSS